MEKTALLQALYANKLFSGVEHDVVSSLLIHPASRLVRFSAGEVIMQPGASAHQLGILISGEAQVYKLAGDSHMLMSVLKSGALLGAATLFLEGARAVTQIRARKNCAVLLIPETLLKECMQKSFTLTENYLAYLTGRIHFLTGRIESIAGSSAADKLLNYVVRNADEHGALRLPYGMGELASVLSISRASLYRVIDELVLSNKIRRDGKTIYLVMEEQEQ